MINAAMVGLGRWGQTVLGSIQGKNDRIRIVHGVTKEPELARELAAKHGFRLSTDLKDAIADPEVQAILLATPHSLHVEQVRMVAAAGKPVWCEKPLALTRAQAEIAIAAVKTAGVPFGTGNNKRCFASMRELKRVVESGEIGKVMHIEGHFSNEHSTRVSGGWRDDPKESPGAGMTGAGMHVLDAFINLAGPISYVDARSIAKKAPRVNLSDLAAKGAVPYGYLLNVALPHSVTADWLKVFAAGLEQDQKDYGIALLGGDTARTEGPLSIAITAFGFVPQGRMPRRSGARIGDDVYVTGTIGDSGGGLAIFRRETHALTESQRDFLTGRYRLPAPPVALRP